MRTTTVMGRLVVNMPLAEIHYEMPRTGPKVTVRLSCDVRPFLRSLRKVRRHLLWFGVHMWWHRWRKRLVRAWQWVTGRS
jgi:hypothetical protein